MIVSCPRGEVGRFHLFLSYFVGHFAPFRKFSRKSFGGFQNFTYLCSRVGYGAPQRCDSRTYHIANGMRWSGILTGYSTFFFSHDKKDRFTEFGKSSQYKRFMFMWGIIPPFARNPHTSILCITSKSIKNESTTTNPKMNISRMSSKCSQSCRSDKRKKTSVIA